jgi:hypothetical protein
MAKTACVFCKKIHDYDIDDALQVLRKTPDTLRELLDDVDIDTLSTRRKTDEWSARELLIHLIDTEFAYGFRFRYIMAEEDPVVAPYNQNSWVNAFKYGVQDATQLIRAFTPLRRVNLELLQTVDRKLFEKTAKHPEYGMISVALMIPHMAAHDVNHLQQIRDRIPAI